MVRGLRYTDKTKYHLLDTWHAKGKRGKRKNPSEYDPAKRYRTKQSGIEPDASSAYYRNIPAGRAVSPAYQLELNSQGWIEDSRIYLAEQLMCNDTSQYAAFREK